MLSLNTAKRFRKRSRHNVLTLITVAALLAATQLLWLWLYPEPERAFFRWSLSTGYAALALGAVTLVLGAWKVIRRRLNPVSDDLRRDLGIWCAFLSLAHSLLGLNVHMRSWTLYFLNEAGWPRTDLFGLGNYLGLMAAILVIILLGTSNDYAIKYLGKTRWKTIQRANYFFFSLVILHGFLYLIIEKRYMPFALVIGLFMLLVLVIQRAGYRKFRDDGSA